MDRKKILELISSYSKVKGYKVNIQNSLTFLYTKNEQVEFEIKNTVPPQNEILRYKSNKIHTLICTRKTDYRNQRTK